VNLLSVLNDWAQTTVGLGVLVTVVHSTIYSAAYLGRPEGREARGVRAGLVVLLLFDLGIAWPLWTMATGHSALYAAGCVAVALLPLLTTVVAWSWTRLRGLEADVARNRALFFGILALLPQLLAAAILFLAV
jgi:hypothetical protein